MKVYTDAQQWAQKALLPLVKLAKVLKKPTTYFLDELA